MDILRSIQVFQCVVEHESFSKAAQTLNLVPSAVSRQINELENWLGVRLLHRTTRSIRLTEEGRKYLLKMSSILSQVDDLKAQPQVQDKLTGSVKISSPIMLGQFEVPRIISSFKQKHPDVQISLILTNRIVDIIEEGYDLAIRTGYLADSNLHARTIGYVSFKTVVSPEYLKNHAPLNEPKDLHYHNCLINSALSKPKRWSYKINDTVKTIKVEGSIETNDSSCILAFAQAGLGVALLPERYVRDALNSGNLVEVLSDFEINATPINLVHLSSRLMNPALRELIDRFSDMRLGLPE